MPEKILVSGKLLPEVGCDGCSFTISRTREAGVVSICLYSPVEPHHAMVEWTDIEEGAALNWLLNRVNLV